MKLLIALTLLIAAAQSYKTKELMEMYRQKKAEYNMNTLSQSRADEKEHFKEFCNFANMVQQHNVEDGDEWQAEVNVFAMMTEAEREQYHGLNVSLAGNAVSGSVEKRSENTETVELEERQSSVDYTSKLPPIKNQGGCGSCWAFGAVASLEYQVNKKSRTVKALSEQQYLDCVYEGKRNGCQGGWPSSCYDWTKNNKNMIASQKDYPYNAKDGVCRTNVKSAISGFQVTGTKTLTRGDTAGMLAAVRNSNIGVLSVAIGVVNSFHSFRSGVYSGTGCTRINHAVDVVGYGTLGSIPYWQVRNSWGANWGEKGYIKMRRGVNMCSIASYAHYPIVTGSGDNSDDKDDNSDDKDEKKTCRWKIAAKTKLRKKLSGLEHSRTAALSKCISDKKCCGVTCKGSKCMLNGSKKGKEHDKFVGYIKICN